MFGQNCCNRRPMHCEMPMDCCGRPMPMQVPMEGCCEREIVEQVMEPTITKCIEKNFMHEVPHVCPMHTHVINKHIYNHTYTPQFTCSEETQIINNDCGKCPGMM